MGGKVLIATLILLIVLASCAQQVQLPSLAQEPQTDSSGGTGANSPAAPPQITQPPQNGREVVKISDILNHPNDFTETRVTIEGKIVSECGAGCWFTINDGTGTIYVDLAPSNLTIPQKRGAFARVHGKVVQKGGDTYIIGEKVEF